MRIQVVAAVVLAMLVVAGTATGGFDYLVELQPTEFDKVVMQSPHVWLVHSTRKAIG